MRRKILIFMLFIFTGFMLAGCDFFGPGTTITIPTTAAPTTEAPTTVAPTTVAPTTAVPTTAVPTTAGPTTVAPTTVAPTTVAPTTAVTTTAPPVTTTTTGATTTTTTQSGTTTTTTQVTTTSTSTQTTTTTLMGDEFDVTFLDWDGTVIDIVTVSPGGSATPPPDPTRPNTLSIIYAFTGWSGTFTNVQGDIIVYATYSATPISNTEYTRADLLYMAAIVMETTDEEQLEGMLDQMMIMMDLSTEQELYDMMSMLATLKQDMMLMDSAAEMQGLLAKAQDLGFDDVLLGKIAANLIAMMLEQEEAYMEEDLLRYQGMLAVVNQEILDYQAELATFDQLVLDFCVTTSSSNCYYLFEQMEIIIPIQLDFEAFVTEQIDNYYIDNWTVYDFIDAVEIYHNAVLGGADQAVIDGYYDEYIEIFNSVSDEERVILNEIFVKFINLNNAKQPYNNTKSELTSEELLEFEGYLLYGWQDEFGEYHQSYKQLFYQIAYAEGNVEYFNGRISEITDEIAMFAMVTSYFNDPLTAPIIQAMVTMIYDGLYASSGVIDQEMIDFIEAIMMLGYSDKYYSVSGMIGFGMGGIEELALSMTAEDITFMINKLGDILVAFESTLTPEEYTLIGDLIKEIFPLAIMDPGMTQTDIDNLKLMVADMVDYYLPTIFATGSDLAHMLQSFTVEKTEALVSVAITMAIGMEMGLEDQMIVQVASAIDILLGDDSLDITLLANTFVDIYFLVDLGPNHGTDLTAIKTAFVANITEIMALAADINDANKMALTPADFANIEELKIRVMTLAWWVDNGFTDMSIDITWTYNQDMLIDTLDYFGLDSTSTGITDIMTVLNATTEEQAYYLLRAMFNYATYFINVRDFADIQAWLANIDQFGLDESEVIDLVFLMVEVALEDDIYGISPEQEYYLDAFVALHDMMLNNPEMVKALMQIMLDDTQNLFATMPADSFDEIFNLVRFMLLPHGSFKDFTPEDILALTQDLSSMLKLIGATMDETDDAAIALALQTYLGYLADAMEITGTEKTDFITQMSGLLIKYIGYAEITVDQFTLILDSLTIEEINMMVKFAHDAYSHRLSDFEMVVFGAAMINNILNIPGFDLDQLTDIYFEVYMDMNYEFTYDALDLQAIQDAFSSFMVDTKALITTVSMIDVTNMDTEDIANIMELMNRFEHMAWYFGNPDPTILTSYNFTYSNDQFIELVMMIFNAAETEAPSVVTELVNLLGMSEEDAYYQVVGIMMVVRNLENARSIGDILNVYRGLRSVGLTNAEIAEYGMTLFMGLGYPTMMDSSSANYYQDEIDRLTQEFANLENEIANKHAYVLAEIEAVSDPVLKAYLLQVWGYSDAIFPADMDSYALIAEFQREHYLDWWIYNNELRPAYISGIQADIDDVYWSYGLDEEEQAFYEAIFAYEQANMTLHQQFMDGVSMISESYYRDLILTSHNQMVQMYINLAGISIDIEWNSMRLAESENDLLMLTAIYNFLGDPVNQALVEDVLVILLDEVEAMSMDPNVKALDILMKFMQEPDLRYLDMNMMVMEMQSLSALMANMGSTIDLADTAVIAQLLNAFIIEYVDVLEITDPLQEAALLADLQGMAVLYLPQVLAMPDVISAFLASMDEAKINQIMSILREYNWISWYHENAELKEAIVDAKLIMAIAGDDSLDYEAVIELVYGIYYDMNDMQGNTLTMTVNDMITEMDDLMLQAEILVEIGLFGITVDNEDDVTLFMTMMNSMFDWEEDPVI